MDSALNKTALNKTMTSSIAERLSRAYEGDPSTPQALIGIWASAGPHFQDQFDIESPRGRANLRKWWLLGGRAAYPGLEALIGSVFVERLHLAHLRHAFLCFRPEAEADPAARWPTSLISPLVATIYRERADLRAIFDIESFEGILGIWQWLMTYGAVDYFGDHPETRWRQIEFFLTETGEPGSDLAERLHPIRVFALAQMTSILVSSKTLSSDLEQFLGIERLHLAHLRHAFLCFRPEAEADPAARWPTSLISPLVATIYRERADLRAIFDIESFEGILGIWQWLLTYGAVDYFGDHPETRWRQIEFFLTETGEPGSDLAERLHPIRVFALAQMTSMLASGGKLPPGLRQFANIAKSIDKTEGIPPLLQIIHRDRSDLTAAFDLKTKDGTGQFIEWWKLFGHEEFYGQHDFAMTTEDASDHDDAVGILNTNVSPIPSGSDDQAKPTVSLIGYPKGEFGLGEDIRLLRRTLGFAGLSPSVIKAPWKIIARQAVSEDAIDVDEADLNCDVMIYVLPAFDTLTLLGKVGTRAFSAKRKIGYWQWELDKFPAPAAMAFELIDEVWCHSEHAAKAFRTATNKPVIKVPLPVEILNFQKGPRAKYEIDEESFAIFTSFDGASSISRKNPMASILAFEQAFPRNRYPNVQLILKAMNALNDPLWRDCLRKALIDDRIQIRNEVMDRREYYELLSCCDAVLSLHRAEGFGRLMADSMAIGIPVIATAYSGNLDFMTGDNSWLVDGTIIPLIAGDYPFTENQEWMEADVTKAALALKECYEDENRRMTVIQNAKQTIKNYFPENCASIYADLLNCPRQTIFPAPNNMGIAIHDPDKTRST